MTLAPGQQGNLTAYGQLASRTAPSGVSLRGIPGQENSIHLLPPGANHSLEGPSRQTASAAEASQLNAPRGEQLLQVNAPPDKGRISFSDLASQKGARKWADEIFDDRWVLRSDEMWNFDLRRRSIFTLSPSPKSSVGYTDAQAGAQEAHAQTQAQAAQAQSRQMQDVFVGTILDRRARSHGRKVTGQDVGQSRGAPAAYAARVGLHPPVVRPRTLAPVLYGLVKLLSRLNSIVLTCLRDPTSLREVKKLARIFLEHVDDRSLLPSVLPFSRRAMREYLRERLFGPEDARFLTRAEREQLILYGSNPITRDALRKYLCVVVDGMAEDMTSPRRPLTRPFTRDLQEYRLIGPDSPLNTSPSPTDPSPSEDYDIIHHHLTIRKAHKQNLQLNDRRPDRQTNQPTSHQTPLRAPQWFPGEQRPDQPANQKIRPHWIPDERQIDRQMSQKMASTAPPPAPNGQQTFSNARPSNPYERQMVPLAPQFVTYPGHGMSHHSQPPSYPIFNPYYQYLNDPGQQYRQNFFSIPHGFPGPYHQMNYFPPQMYAPPHLAQPPPVNPIYGRHQHQPFIPAMHIPAPVMPAVHIPASVMPAMRPAAAQRVAPKVLRAGLLEFDANTMGPPRNTSTAIHPETAQPFQQSSHSIPSGSARIPQPLKDSAPTESAQLLKKSAYMTSSSAQSHPSSTILASSSVRLPQPLTYSSSHGLAQPALPLRPSFSSGPFPNVIPAVRPLPYQAGSDITKSHSVGASNVKLKDLTRHGRPSFAIAINEDITPFVQSAKESKPAEWGVVKVSNVS